MVIEKLSILIKRTNFYNLLLFVETVEESTSSRTIYDSELRRMHLYIKQLQNEIEELKSEKEKQSPHHTIVVSFIVCFFLKLSKEDCTKIVGISNIMFIN